MTFPIAGHGACRIDQLFSTVKIKFGGRRLVSLGDMRRVLADAEKGKHINLRELTHVHDFHNRDVRPWPSGAQDFHAFYCEKNRAGAVVLQAKQFLGSRLVSDKEHPLGDLWAGTEDGTPLELLPGGVAIAPLAWHMPRLRQAEKCAAAILKSSLSSDPDAKAWWRGFAVRYANCAPLPWTPPTPVGDARPYAVVDQQVINTVAQLLDLTLAEKQNISPLHVSWYWRDSRTAKRNKRRKQERLGLPAPTGKHSRTVRPAASGALAGRLTRYCMAQHLQHTRWRGSWRRTWRRSRRRSRPQQQRRSRSRNRRSKTQTRRRRRRRRRRQQKRRGTATASANEMISDDAAAVVWCACSHSAVLQLMPADGLPC
jgi:hypothetical protein